VQVGKKKSLFSTSISLRRVLSTLRPSDIINTVPPDRGKLTLIAGCSKGRRLLIAGDERRSVYDKKPQRYAEDNRRAIVRSGKSEAKVSALEVL